MFICRDLGDRVVTSRIWSSDVDITRIKLQVSCVYLFFFIMIFVQFHYMVDGRCKPSNICTNICLKNIKQCLFFLFDRLWLQPVIVLLSIQNPLLSTYYCFLIIQIIWYTFYHSGGKVFEESESKQEVFGSMMKECFLIYFAVLTSLLSF